MGDPRPIGWIEVGNQSGEVYWFRRYSPNVTAEIHKTAYRWTGYQTEFAWSVLVDGTDVVATGRSLELDSAKIYSDRSASNVMKSDLRIYDYDVKIGPPMRRPVVHVRSHRRRT